MSSFIAKQIQPRPYTGAILHDASSHYSPLIKRILAARGINHSDELNFVLKQLHPQEQPMHDFALPPPP